MGCVKAKKVETGLFTVFFLEYSRSCHNASGKRKHRYTIHSFFNTTCIPQIQDKLLWHVMYAPLLQICNYSINKQKDGLLPYAIAQQKNVPLKSL